MEYEKKSSLGRIVDFFNPVNDFKDWQEAKQTVKESKTKLEHLRNRKSITRATELKEYSIDKAKLSRRQFFIKLLLDLGIIGGSSWALAKSLEDKKQPIAQRPAISAESSSDRLERSRAAFYEALLKNEAQAKEFKKKTLSFYKESLLPCVAGHTLLKSHLQSIFTLYQQYVHTLGERYNPIQKKLNFEPFYDTFIMPFPISKVPENLSNHNGFIFTIAAFRSAVFDPKNVNYLNIIYDRPMNDSLEAAITWHEFQHMRYFIDSFEKNNYQLPTDSREIPVLTEDEAGGWALTIEIINCLSHDKLKQLLADNLHPEEIVFKLGTEMSIPLKQIPAENLNASHNFVESVVNYQLLRDFVEKSRSYFNSAQPSTLDHFGAPFIQVMAEYALKAQRY